MRAIEILHDRLTKGIGFVHATRWASLWKTVSALIAGEQLWLTALGRARPGSARPKHAIKAVDRLLGNETLYSEVKPIYRALAGLLLRKHIHSVILVDTVELGWGRFAMTAAIAFDGRPFPIYSMSVSATRVKKDACRRFLSALTDILPKQCRPIFVTDAGFERPWFEVLEERGFDYVGRVRNRTKIFWDKRWQSVQALYRQAASRAKNVGDALFPRKSPKRRRLVLSRKRKSGHRKRLTSQGRPGNRSDDKRYANEANEPWLLVTTLGCRPSQVIDLYALRMQIEESFRDLKNHRWGWSLRHCRTRSAKRLEILLLIAALAIFVQQTVGVAAEQIQLHRHYQANTERRRRVLGIFVLGGLVLRSRDAGLLTERIVKTALATIHKTLEDLAP